MKKMPNNLNRNGLAEVLLYEKRAKRSPEPEVVHGIKYQDELLAAEKEAKEKRIGIWVNQ
jgi:micrococcal nuclease